MQKPFFMVYLEGQQTPTFKHEELAEAEKEAKRLTDKFQLKSYVLATIKSFQLPEKFVVEDIRPFGVIDDLPF